MTIEHLLAVAFFVCAGIASTAVIIDTLCGGKFLRNLGGATTNNTTQQPLPDKPSELIRVALEDLTKVEALPEVYEPNMDRWHRPNLLNGKCAVCLAGAVMSMRFGVGPEEFVRLGAGRFTEKDKRKFLALDKLRRGHVIDALWYLGIKPRRELKECYPVTAYEESPIQFKRDLKALAKILEGVGL